MMSGNPPDLPYGGACAWWLPGDACCAAQARSALSSMMQALAFPAATIDDGALAVSELATNTFRHATGPRPADLIAAPELWVWARTVPRAELVVAVFDAVRGSLPEVRTGDLLTTHGRGLGIVEAIVSAWGGAGRGRGWPRSRSWARLCGSPCRCRRPGRVHRIASRRRSPPPPSAHRPAGDHRARHPHPGRLATGPPGRSHADDLL
jgi:hypothetical protein